MSNNNELQLLEFKTTLLGLWQAENKTFSYLFHGEIVDIYWRTSDWRIHL